MEENELLSEMQKLVQKTGGKQAARLFLSSAGGAVPIVGSWITSVNSYWGEAEQEKFNVSVCEWARKADRDIKSLLDELDKQLNTTTKAHLALLIGEITGKEISRDPISIVLNSETIGELQPFVKEGWLELRKNGNMTNLGAGNRVGNSIEDLKRPWGMGTGFSIQILEPYFDNSPDT
ncbi:MULTISPECIES: hypothetical protein [Cycloclasticus]|uniref:Uncharacterized protein n=1 Tax=Cycloclasticus pugetii TaxID=34068 RepID=A0AB33Z2J3_9GAMM|nr:MULTISPECIES: hypothetical protein [Cycloclasticus]ATI01960.1 hypothetical protein CPC19_00350 [Cycloclasticus sp. PY97N]EPD13299.1 hypothetical protein L196_06640 [Cycloclasticus pugetii]